MNLCIRFLATGFAFFMLAGVAVSQTPQTESVELQAPLASPHQDSTLKLSTYDRSSYVLGPEDQVAVKVLHVEEIAGQPLLIDLSGNINLPLVGRMRAAALTVEELETELAERLKNYVQAPEVTVNIIEFRSQPVSVLGAVNNPGIHQLRGSKTLFEVLSLAGGLRPDAGHSVKISRRMEWGRIPLSNATEDPSGQFCVAEVNLKSIMEARNPTENIAVKSHDVISVPRADMIYVIGEVPRSGGFVLNERDSMSILQALSLAGGLGRTAAPRNAKILRAHPDGSKRTEVLVDLTEILTAKSSDLPLNPDDILFIPGSTGKKAAFRVLEAVVGMGASMGAGMAIYR